MKFRVLFCALVLASPALAQSKPPVARADPCAPIGRTANGQLVYSMKCENLPVPVAPVRAEGAAPVAPAAVEEEDKGGLFRNPFPSLVRPSNSERIQGVGPPPASR
ncbi:MAG: hypothetical protein JWR89_3083 [Tardiphaga sp.]|uniref:hypothetical protein n=1 Tax=Tardiphaga sp. TaxID=1926292 RepID=UPI0026226791|nr:hypothetical protein [Tardiphaga sp.]MDB5503181.1 hypothetical protein [Tardiphaga sp.]